MGVAACLSSRDRSRRQQGWLTWVVPVSHLHPLSPSLSSFFFLTFFFFTSAIVVSKEKIKPEKELEKARKKILEYKLSICEVIRPLDSVNSVGSNSKFCERRLEIVEATNAYLGTQFSLDTTWQCIDSSFWNVVGFGKKLIEQMRPSIYYYHLCHSITFPIEWL